MMPLRAAMPRTVTNPTSDPSDSTPPERNAAATPPIRANGSVSATSATRRADAEVDVQHQQDPEQREQAERQQAPLRRFARGVLAQHLGVVPGLERHAGQRRPDVAGDGAEIAALHVASSRRCGAIRLRA